MKADLTRSTFSPQKHFHDVRLQQGRVQLDAEWNEQIDIAAHRVETETVDVVGTCGAPVHDGAFQIAPQVTDLPTDQQPAATALGALAAGDFFLSAGRFYAHGVLCENDAPVKFSQQPDLPGATPIASSGLYLAYLDVWPRLVTFLDDSSLREVALNGPDTAVRSKTVWQVKLVKVGATGATPDCSASFPAYDAATAVPTGKLSARAEPGSANTKPCIIEPGAGYRSLENQLYRIEVHQPGPNGTATFKWSRDNGSVVAAWKPTANPQVLQLLRPPPDEKLGFAVGQWVEISDDTSELNGQPGMLVQITKVEPQYLTLGTLPQPLSHYTANPKVRRWDSANAADTAGDISVVSNKWIDLENGVQVQFEAGTFRTGDYWLVPARTATADVEWPKDSSNSPIPALPEGIPHAYCRVGFADFNGTTITQTDCRPLFPPLTEITQNGDLKLHNKHLHGWGVVCGLQVHCGGDRTHVTVETGHAIDCEGTDILLKSPASIDVVAQAKAQKLLDNTDSGDVVIRLTADTYDQPVFDVLAPQTDPNKTVLQQILDGTLWMDFYNHCLQPLVTYWKNEFTPAATDTKLVPDSKRRLTSLVNAAYQLGNSAAGRRIWISNTEHTFLQGLYNDLVTVLSSDTFCAIKDNLAAFPSYPFASTAISTAFGKTALNGARLTSDGSTIIAYDNGTTGNFYLFDAATGEMTFAGAVTNASPLTVRDVYVYKNSNGAFQVLFAATGNGNTTLATFDLTSRQFVGPAFNYFGTEIVRFEPVPTITNLALALVVGQGLFMFDPTSLSASSFAQASSSFNAAGHMTLSGNILAATVSPQGVTGGSYNSLMIGRVDSAGPALQNVPLVNPDGTPTTGSDGLSLVLGSYAATNFASTLYVVADAKAGQTNKRILIIDPLKGASSSEQPLPTNGGVAVATVNQKLVIGLTDESQLLWLDPTTNVVDTTQALPVQISPAAFATVSNGDFLFYGYNAEFSAKAFAPIARPVIAVNRTSQTLTLIPGNLLGVTPAPVDFTALGTYHDNLIAAFKDVVLRLVQALKDCLCDRLLLDCPTCTDSDVIYLADVEIKSGKVYHICNFIRRDVLTFPKVKYWLSAVPVIPLIHWAVQKFCCSVLPELAAEINPTNGFVSGLTTHAMFERLQTQNFSFNLTDTFSRYNTIGKFAAQALVARTVQMPTPASVVQTAPAAVLQASPQTATAALADQGVTVASVTDYHNALVSDAPLIDASAVPLNLQPGDKVNLYTQNGRVVYYTKVAPDTGVTGGTASAVSSAAPGTDVVTLQKQVASLQTQFAALQQAHAQALASRDQQLAELKATTEKLAAHLAAPIKAPAKRRKSPPSSSKGE